MEKKEEVKKKEESGYGEHRSNSLHQDRSIKRTAEYYNSISEGYEELHREEQEKKLAIIKQKLQITSEDRLLDVGCGTGITSQFDCKVTGVDPAKRLIEKAMKKTEEQKVKNDLKYPRTWVVAPAEK